MLARRPAAAPAQQQQGHERAGCYYNGARSTSIGAAGKADVHAAAARASSKQGLAAVLCEHLHPPPPSAQSQPTQPPPTLLRT